MKILYTFLLSFVIYGCKNERPANVRKPNSETIYPTVSYLDIKLDEAGHLPQNPYLLKFKYGRKEIVFCGVNHLTDDSDVANPMFVKIEKEFFKASPDVAVNEGGDVSAKHYQSKHDALLQDGEIRLLKVLSDSLHIQTINGDITAADEFKELLKHYSKGEFLAYMITERLMWGLKGAQISNPSEIAERYNKFVKEYIINQGKVVLSSDEQTFEFYTDNYQKILGRKFDLNELEPTNPFDANSKFQAIGRKSKEIRDQHLLSKIDRLLDLNDKVFVVFGGWHLLTCKPGLEQIVARKRK